MLKVLYYNHTGLFGGGERALLDLIEGMEEGIHAHLAVPAGPAIDVFRRVPGLHVAQVRRFDPSFTTPFLQAPVVGSRLIAAATSLRRAVRHAGPDIVHANSARAGLVATAALLGSRIPLLTSLRDALPGGARARGVATLLAHRSAILAANSQHTAASFPVGTRAGQMATIHDGIDLARFTAHREDRESARRSLRLPVGARVMGVVAQITPWKGQEDAIAALAILRQSRPEMRLALVGEVKFAGPGTRYDNAAFERRLRALAQAPGVDGAVDFLGSRDDVPAVMRALDVLVVPSWQEPFGLVIPEAMASGVPVVATNRGGPSEIITNGVDGILVEPCHAAELADAVSQALEPRRRASLVRGGRLRATDFDHRRQAGCYRELYARATRMDGLAA